MRILAIRGRNIASLPEFEVNFEAEPLSHTGLYAIVGPTGSGKTTLLDTICVTLFDRTPRLGGSGGAKLLDVDGVQEIASSSPGSLLRLGAGFCWTEVDFEGVDKMAYRARWSLQRANRRPSGRLQLTTRKVRLWRLDPHPDGGWHEGEPLGDHKRSTVLKLIEKRIGLTYAQFTRAVMLAQGEFAAFLEADANERAELLVKLTGDDTYGTLSVAAFQRHKAAEDALDKLRIAANRTILTPEARAELEAQIDAQTAQVDTLEGLGRTAEQAVEWHRQAAQLQGAVDAAKTAHEAARQAVTDAAPRRAHLQQIERADPHRGTLSRADDCQRQLDDCGRAVEKATTNLDETTGEAQAAHGAATAAATAQDAARVARREAEAPLQQARRLDEKVAGLQRQLEESEGARTAAQGDRDRAKANLDTLGQTRAQEAAAAEEAKVQLDAQPALVGLAGSWAAWRDRVQRAGEAAQALDTTTHTAEETARVLAAADQAATRAIAAAAAAAETSAAARAARDAHEAQKPGDPEDALQRRRRALTTQRDALRGLADSDAALLRATSALDAHQRTRAEQATLAATEQAAAAEAAAGLAAHGARRQAAQDQLRRIKDALGYADRRAQELTPDHPCPLCGSTDHPFAHDAPGNELLKAQEDELAQAEAAFTAAQGRQARHTEASRGAQQQVVRLDAEILSLTEQIDAATRTYTLRAASVADAPPVGSTDRGARLEASLQAADVALAALDTAVESWVSWRAQATTLDQELQHAQAAAQGATAERATQATALSVATERHSAAAAARQQADAAWTAAGEVLAPQADALTGWRDAVRTDLDGFLSKIQGRVDGVQALKQRRDEATAELASLDARLPELTRQLAEAEDRLAQRAAVVSTQGAQLSTGQEERAALFSGRPATEVQDALDQAVREAEAAAEAARGRASSAVVAQAAAEAELKAQTTAFESAHHKSIAAGQALDAALATLGIDRVTLTALLAQGPDWRTTERAALSELDTALTASEATQVDRAARLAGHQQTHPGVDKAAADAAVAAHRTALAEAREGLQAQRTKRTQDDDNRAHIADYVQRITDAEAHLELWERMTNLIGSAKGTKFRRFAQSLTLEILLAEANHQLRTLAPRYALQRVPGEELALQVIDVQMADTIRSIRSLSGGERFLVSLALALALSALSSSRANIGSLFIDEGFGTLDPVSLDRALSALLNLQATGRSVGLISHVRGLADQIGVRIQVERVGTGTSRVRVVGPGGQ